MKGVRPEAWATTDAICKDAIRRSGAKTASLAFSTGKDSLALLLAMSRYFDRILSVYWYLVPELGFVERSIKYYEEQFPQLTVIRLPHPDRFDLLDTYAFQPPHRITALDAILAEVPKYSMDELWDEVREVYGLNDLGAFHATGIRAADSPIRASLFRKHGGFAPNGRVFYPVITWNLDDIEGAIDHSGLWLPPEYTWLGRSWDGIMRRYMEPIATHYPDDMRRVLDDFPLADLEFYRARLFDVDRRIPMHKLVGKAESKDK